MESAPFLEPADGQVLQSSMQASCHSAIFLTANAKHCYAYLATQAKLCIAISAQGLGE